MPYEGKTPKMARVLILNSVVNDISVCLVALRFARFDTNFWESPYYIFL